MRFENDKFPVINNKGRRIITYDFDKIENFQKDVSGLIQFNEIINNSEPIKIPLQKDEILIINNHRILYKILSAN